MATEIKISIPDSIKENIYAYRLSHFLKLCGRTYSGNKQDLIQRIEVNLTEDNFRGKFLEFLAEELSNGRNRQMFISKFELSNLAVLRNNNSVKANLAAGNFPNLPFNNLLKEELNDGEMVFLHIENDPTDSNKVLKIKMCFYKEIIPSDQYNGDREIFQDYVWIDILTEEQLILLKIRPHTRQYLTNLHTSKKTYEDVFSSLKGIFPLTIINMEYTKQVLYTIFKDLTELAEQPYRESIQQHIDKADDFHTQFLPLLGIQKEEDIQEIKTRYSRLIERTLIVNDIENYLTYHSNRIGIVERIALKDLSGASANVLSGDSDGLDVADFYFDIRETIDNMKKLDKLWVKWFLYTDHLSVSDAQIELLPEEDDEEVDIQSVDEEHTIVTRFEVTKDYVIINFMKKPFVSKEVQDYVLSRFNEFEEKTNQHS